MFINAVNTIRVILPLMHEFKYYLISELVVKNYLNENNQLLNNR